MSGSASKPSDEGPGIRREGFPGRRLVVLPYERIKRESLASVMTSGLIPMAAGIFPAARGHRINRPRGIMDNILIVCTGGAGWCEVDGRCWQVAEGQAAMLPSNRPHAYGADDDRPWTIAWVHFRGREVPAFCEFLGFDASRIVRPGPEAGAAESILGRICDAISDTDGAAGLVLASALLRLFLAELAMTKVRPAAASQTSTQSVVKTVEWVRDHLDHPLRLRDLAASAGLSVPHYSQLFRHMYGAPPMQYLRHLRVRQAAEMLLNDSSQSIGEVGSAVGFADPFHFSRVFRNEMGMPPRAYRQQIKG